MARGPVRLAPLAGIVFVVLVVIAFVLGGESPEADAPARQIASFYSENEIQQALSAYVLILAVPFLVIFGSALRGALSVAEGSGATWANVAFAGAVISATGFLVGAATVVSLTDGAEHGFPPEVMQAINAVSSDTFPIFVGGLGIMLLGAAGAILGGVGLARWLGWLALVIGVAIFVVYVSFFAFAAAGIWTIIASVVLYRAARVGGGEDAQRNDRVAAQAG